MYYRDYKVTESEWRVSNPEAAGVLNSVITGLTFGLVHYEPSKVRWYRDHFLRETWIQNTCVPGEKRDIVTTELSVSDWYTRNYGNSTHPDDIDNGNLAWAWGQDVTDFGGGQLTISTGQLYIHPDGTISTNPANNPDNPQSQGDQSEQQLPSHEDEQDQFQSTDMSPIYMMGYDDVQGDDTKSNFLSVRGGLPREINADSVLKGSDIVSLFKSAYINGSRFGAVHIDPNKLYKVSKMEFKSSSNRTIDDPNLIPVPVKYGYWALYLRLSLIHI